ncbi:MULTISPECIES: hypothetical protein [unclassified Thioalkalivibrio]|uniref:hypothetical protein n=1 Tax=unclassified Thioalkalivibrio TaxID=2621013 RepID=UPI000475A368|nr:MULTISPECIES: hypothetical protein [unclassified Thioalkalivibrio]
MPGKWIVGVLAVAAAGIGYYHYEIRQVEQKLDDMAETLQPLGTLHYADVGIGLGGQLHVNRILFEPRDTAVGRIRAERITLETGNLWHLLRLRHTLDARRLPRQLGFAINGLTLPAGFTTGAQGDVPALWLDTAGCGSYQAAPPDDLLAALGYRDIPLDMSIRYHLEEQHNRFTVHSTLGMGPLGLGTSTGHFELQAASNRVRDVAPALMTASLRSLTVDYEDRGYYPALMELCAAEMGMEHQQYLEHHKAAWLEAWEPFGVQPGPLMVEAYGHFIQQPRGYSVRFGPIENPALLWSNLDSPTQWLGQVESSLSVAGRPFGRLDLRPISPRPARQAAAAGARGDTPVNTSGQTAEPPRVPTIALNTLGDHIGRSLRITLADGRARNGELLEVHEGHIRVRRRFGSGYMVIPIALADIDEVRSLR